MRTWMPARPVLEVRGLHKRFGSLIVAADVHLDVHPFRLHSLIGPNGAGKTTFFNMLTGLLRADAGEIRFDGHDITRPAGAPAHPTGPQPLVPDPQRVPQPDGVRERPRRGAGAEPRSRTRCGATPTGLPTSTRAPGRCSPRSGWRIAPPNHAPICRTASSACWRSPSRSPPMPGCCCWTNRWPDWRKPIARWSAR